MNLRIADTFQASLAKLTAQEQAAAKQTAFDIQIDPSAPGLSLHRVDRAKDKNFWTARVSRDIRIVLHRQGDDTLLAFVGHHDDAYQWAERRKLEIHPRTGAAQIVEVRERVEEIIIPRYVEAEIAAPPLFPDIGEDDLLDCGVPPEWLDDVRRVASEDALLELADHLPREAGEALLDRLYGAPPQPKVAADLSIADPYAHPDAQRRFRLFTDEAELARALDAPWEAWTVFLHPAQRGVVQQNFAGPARITGSAGTGKTVVALHRAVRLAGENGGARVLLATFNEGLARHLQGKLDLLTEGDPARDRITVSSLHDAAIAMHEELIGPVRLAEDDIVHEMLAEARAAFDVRVDEHFLTEEWRAIIDARDTRDADAYRDLPRAGRRQRLTGEKRAQLWDVFARVRERLEREGLTTYPAVLHALARHFQTTAQRTYDHVLVDEAQDIALHELVMLAALAGNRPNGLFFAGDIGQRIFRPPFSWLSVGVDIRGRLQSLRVNYRTSHQIRRQSDLLLPSRLVEADGSEENRRLVQSLFHGPAPVVRLFDDEVGETASLKNWLAECVRDGIEPNQIAVFVRHAGLFDRFAGATSSSGDAGGLRVMTMHQAKGMEFRAVAVVGCDEDVLPLEERLEEASDESAISEIYATERHLLYVAATRARERLIVTGLKPGSEFLADLSGSLQKC